MEAQNGKTDDIMREVESIFADKEKLKKVMKNAGNSMQDRDEILKQAESNPELARQIEEAQSDPRVMRKARAAGPQVMLMKNPRSKPGKPAAKVPQGTPNIVLIAVGSEKLKLCHPPLKETMKDCAVIPFKDNTMCMIFNTQSTKKNAKATRLAVKFTEHSKICGSVYVCNMNNGILLETTVKEIENLLLLH